MNKAPIVFEEGSGNVYADLGFPDAEEMRVKARLANKISQIIKARKWTQTEAAKVLGLSQPKLSNLLRGNFQGISETKMMECLNSLGRDVRIVIGPAKRTMGKVEVVYS